MTQGTITVKNNAIRLPGKFRKEWNGLTVAVLVPTRGDTLILKRIAKPLMRLSEIASRNKRARVSRARINREIAAYRAKK